MSFILFNGKIRTGDNCFMQAVLLEDGRIKAVGENEEILAMDKNAEKIDLQGRLALPGFNDSHLHFVNVGHNFSQIDLGKTKSICDAIALIKEKTETADFGDETEGKVRWIQCFGWNDDNWTEKRNLDRYDLDQISKDQPIMATRVCTHVCTVNSKGLELLGIEEGTPQPTEGSFGTDDNGVPNGILYEMLPLVYDKMAEPSIDEIKDMILEASRAAAAKGLTSVQPDDLRSLPGQNMQHIVEAYRQLSEEGKMLVRVYEQCRLMSQADYDEFVGYGFHAGQGDSMFRLGPLKTFCDGSLGARTAWLQEEYTDDPGNKGISIYGEDQVLFDLITRAHRDGMSVAIHCIGDAAAEQAVSAIENAVRKYPEQQNRHGIVHAQILNDDLMERMKKIGIIAYIQPIFLEYDLHMAESRIGAERLENSYHYRKLYDLGICIPFGTDCPVERFDPLPNIYCAVTGKDLEGMPLEGWHPEKLLTVEEAVKCYTEYPAWVSFEETYKGKIAPEFLADIVVLDEDIFEIPKEHIKDVDVFLTVMDGKVTYQKNK